MNKFSNLSAIVIAFSMVFILGVEPSEAQSDLEKKRLKKEAEELAKSHFSYGMPFAEKRYNNAYYFFNTVDKKHQTYRPYYPLDMQIGPQGKPVSDKLVPDQELAHGECDCKPCRHPIRTNYTYTGIWAKYVLKKAHMIGDTTYSEVKGGFSSMAELGTFLTRNKTENGFYKEFQGHYWTCFGYRSKGSDGKDPQFHFCNAKVNTHVEAKYVLSHQLSGELSGKSNKVDETIETIKKNRGIKLDAKAEAKLKAIMELKRGGQPGLAKELFEKFFGADPDMKGVLEGELSAGASFNYANTRDKTRVERSYSETHSGFTFRWVLTNYDDKPAETISCSCGRKTLRPGEKEFLKKQADAAKARAAEKARALERLRTGVPNNSKKISYDPNSLFKNLAKTETVYVTGADLKDMVATNDAVMIATTDTANAPKGAKPVPEEEGKSFSIIDSTEKFWDKVSKPLGVIGTLVGIGTGATTLYQFAQADKAPGLLPNTPTDPASSTTKVQGNFAAFKTDSSVGGKDAFTRAVGKGADGKMVSSEGTKLAKVGNKDITTFNTKGMKTIEKIDTIDAKTGEVLKSTPTKSYSDRLVISQREYKKGQALSGFIVIESSKANPKDMLFTVTLKSSNLTPSEVTVTLPAGQHPLAEFGQVFVREGSANVTSIVLPKK